MEVKYRDKYNRWHKPPNSPKTDNPRVMVYVGEDVKRRLVEMSEDTGVAITAIVRRMIEEGLEKEEP